MWYRNIMLSPLAFVVLVAAISNSTTTANESSATSTPTSLVYQSLHNIYIRQQQATPAPLSVPAVMTSSWSYNYWWPYPPAGAPLAPTTSTEITTMATPELVFSFVPSSSSTALSTSTYSTTQTNDTSLTNSASTSAPTIIQITALPALPSNATTSPTIQHKLHPHAQFKLVYLAPLFVVLGVVFGSACAWVGYGCVTRGPRDNRGRKGRGELEVGPAYRDLGGDAERGKEKGSWIARTLFVEKGLEKEGDREKEQQGKVDEVFSWPTFGRVAGGGVDVVQGDVWRGEDDPFLLCPPLRPHASKSKSESGASRAKSTKSCRTTRTKSARTAQSVYSDTDTDIDPLSLLSPTQYHSSDDEEGEKIPWESLRHKSIKRGILERVGEEEEKLRLVVSGAKSKIEGGSGRRRISHGRTDSDLCVGHVSLGELAAMQRPERAYSRSSLTGDDGLNDVSASRAGSTMTTGSTGSMGRKGKGGVAEWIAGSGFRIVQEDGGVGDGKGSCLGNGDGGDRYTALPVRKARGRSASPVKGASPGRREAIQPWALPRADSSVLPQSPPQITSPLLESRLCFTPMVGAYKSAATPTLTSKASPLRASRITPTTPTPTGRINDSDGRRGRQGLKHHSVHPPPLPFPTPGANLKSPYRGRLVKSPDQTPQKDILPSYRPIGDSSSASSSTNHGTNNMNINKGRGTPAQRYTARQCALQKVDEIVERSWSMRPVGMRSLSPTGFGARV